MTPAPQAAGIEHAALIAALHNSVMQAGWSATSVVRLLGLPGAFAFVWRTAREPGGTILVVPGGDGLEIASLVVLPSYRRRGAARALLDAAVAAAGARRVPRLDLEVRADNRPALALYRSAGFTEAGRRRAYYAARPGKAAADAVLMRLTLDSDPE